MQGRLGYGAAMTVARRPPQPKVELPTLPQLKTAFGTWQFHAPNHQLAWKTKRPVNAVLKEFVVQKPPTKGIGDSVRGYVLKRDPTKVYFERSGRAVHYFGPVSWKTLPTG